MEERNKMSISNHYTVLYGYCINDKFDLINNIENSEDRYNDGIPEFSLNYYNNKVGYKIVKDCIGREELYFGVLLKTFEDCEDVNSKCYDIEELIDKYFNQINVKYRELFKENPQTNIKMCFICESR